MPWLVSQAIRVCQHQAGWRFGHLFGGVHTYTDIWEPREGGVLLLQREPDNDQDKFAVSVMRNGLVVGHIPRTLEPLVSQFLQEELQQSLVPDHWEKSELRRWSLH